MNLRNSFQLPQQSFPTDVTSPAPTQLPGGAPEAPNTQTDSPAKRPHSDRTIDEDEQEAMSEEFAEFARRASAIPQGI